MVYTFPHLGERTQMPWNECKPMDERLRFVARLLEGEKMAPLCREFGISRVSGYKIFKRYKACGLDGRTSPSDGDTRNCTERRTFDAVQD